MEYRGGVFAIIALLLLSLLPLTVSADSDGDGIGDSTDDCIWSAGTSSMTKPVAQIVMVMVFRISMILGLHQILTSRLSK